MTNTPCKSNDFAAAKSPELLNWLRNARKESRGKFVVYSATFSVLEALREHGWPLSRADFISEGNQIRMSGTKFRRVLRRLLGADRVSRLKLPSEGGRTTRSAPKIAEKFVEWLTTTLPPSLSEKDAAALANCWEFVIAEEFERYMRSISAIQVSKPAPQRPLSAFVRQVIEAADKNRGAVIHHLVGAKLALRFNKSEGLEPRSYTAADQQADVPGDYWYEDTAFHVTAAPARKLFEKCRNNIAQGWRVWVITIREKVAAAQVLADDVEAGLSQRIQIMAVSDFVGQNLEEIGGFSSTGVSQEAEDLIREYNSRIETAENGDPSLKIEFGA